MNPRERVLAIALLGAVILIGGGFLVLQLVVKPLDARNASIALLRQDVAKKQLDIATIQAQRARLDRWRQMSLPADIDLAQRDYEKYLNELLRQSKFPAGVSRVIPPRQVDTRSSGTLPGRKEPLYAKLTYTVETQGDLTNLVALLERFYRTGLLHQIKRLTVQRPLTQTANQRPTDLTIRLNIEALVLQGAEARPYLAPVEPRLVLLDAVAGLRRGPTGLAAVVAAAGPAGPLGARTLATPARQYASIANKNIFYGPPPPPPEKPAAPPSAPVDKTDVTPFVVLTDITHSPTKVEAFLFDHYSSRRIRLQNSPGFDTFRIRNAGGETNVAGKVVRIDERDLFFVVDDKHYACHVGQTLKEALAKALTAEQVKELGVKGEK